MRFVLIAALGGALISSAAAIEAPINQSADQQSTEQITDAIRAGYSAMQAGDLQSADRSFQSVISAPAFDSLKPAVQHAVLLGEGLLLQSMERNAEAHPLLVRACGYSATASSYDWAARLQTAYALGDFADAGESLVKLAHAWPMTIRQFNDQAVFRILSELKKSPDGQSLRFQLMDALYAAHWKVEGALEPSWVWMELSLHLLSQGESSRAEDVADHVEAVSSLIEMRVDNRYAPIVNANPTHFDIKRAADSQVQKLRDLVAKAPRSLTMAMELQYALLSVHKEAEVIAIADEVIAKIKNAKNGETLYDDQQSHLIWIMDSRARALERLGRWDEAVAQLSLASRRPESGGMNVSQAINLGVLYVKLGRAKEALAVVSEVGSMSPYGHMQLESVKYQAAVQLGDSATADAAFAYLQTHQEDAEDTYQEALIHSGKLDEAAKRYIARVEAPETRSDALLEAQNFIDLPTTDAMTKWKLQWKALLARADVQQAINKVGKVERYAVTEPLT